MKCRHCFGLLPKLYRDIASWVCSGMEKLYCNMAGLRGLKGCFYFYFFLYYNTHGVLWLGKDLGLRIVSQYNRVYCDKGVVWK